MDEKERHILEKAKEKGLINQKKIEKILKKISKAKYKEDKITEKWGILLGEIIKKGWLKEEIISLIEKEIEQETSIKETKTASFISSKSSAKIETNLFEEVDSKSFNENKIFSKYEILELLAIGGMGQVYKAYDTTLNRYVALKFLKKDEPARLKRFLREARMQAKVDNKNICKVYEANEIDGKPYIAMQLINGIPLDEASHQMSLIEKIKVIQTIAEALNEAHNLGLIHRDIKPKNILVEKSEKNEWTPYILDFGLARQQDDISLSMDGSIFGTPVYMAPETLRTGIVKVDYKADIYSLGATFYELLTGKTIFQGATYGEIFLKILTENVIPLRKINPSIPQDLEIIIMKCLEKQPSLRYNTAKELAADLKRFLEGEPILARPITWRYKLIKKTIKHKNAVIFTFIALLIIIIISTYYLYNWKLSKEQLQVSINFNQSVRYIEELLRHAYTAPLHDIRIEQKEAIQLLNKIEEQMDSIGKPATGPGNYAIGKSYLLLKNYDKAKFHLQAAEKAEYSIPELYYSAGQLYGIIYSKKIQESEKIKDDQIKETFIKEIEKQFKIPAINYLNKTKNIKIESPEYIEAQIAFYERNYKQALKKLQTVSIKIPWLYEAKRLEGDIFLLFGQQHHKKAAYEKAKEYYQQAERYYKQAVEIGRSDPDNYVALCNLWNILFQLEALEKGGSVEPYFNNSLQTCNNALIANPDNPEPYKLKAILYSNLSEYEQFNGINPLPTIDKAIEIINSAINIHPNEPSLFNVLSFIYIKRAKLEYEKGINPSNSLKKALQASQKSYGLYPNDSIVHNNIGIIYLTQAQYDLTYSKNPYESIKKSIEEFQNAINLEKNYAFAYNNTGRAYWLLSEYIIQKQQDPSEYIQKAIESYDKAIKIQPSFLMAINNKATSYIQYAEYQMAHGINQNENLNKALNIFKKSLEINPNSADIYRKIAHIHLLRAEIELNQGNDPSPYANKAITLIEKAINIDPSFSFNYNTIAEAYKIVALYLLDTGNNPLPYIQNAKNSFMKAMELQKDNIIASANFIELLYIELNYYLSQNNYPEKNVQYTINFIEKTLSTNPSMLYPYIYSILVYNTIAEYEIENSINPNLYLNKSEELIQKINTIDSNNHYAILQELSFLITKIQWLVKNNMQISNLIKQSLDKAKILLNYNKNHIKTNLLVCKLFKYAAESKINNAQPAITEIKKGLGACNKVLFINPNNSYAMANIGILYFLQSIEYPNNKNELLQNANNYLEKAVSLNKNLPQKYKKYLNIIKFLSR